MKIKLDRTKRYSRINNIILEDGKEIIKLKQEFPVNIEKFDINNFMYHEYYISNNPDKIEWLVKENKYILKPTLVLEPVKRGRGRPKKNVY